MIMFVKYVYDHYNDVSIIGLGFLGRSDHWYKKYTFRFKVETMTTIWPNRAQKWSNSSMI